MKITNLSPHPFSGWVRVNSDDPSMPAEGYSTRNVVRGLRTGIDTHAADVFCPFLSSGETLTVKTPTAVGTGYVLPAIPPDFFPSPAPTYAGTPFVQVTQPTIDGAAITQHWRHRDGALVVDLWLRWYPLEPWVHGEVLVTRSNPATSLLYTDMPLRLPIAWGDAIVHAGVTPPDTVVEGQCFGGPILFGFINRARSLADLHSFQALMTWGVMGHGIRKLHHDGNPRQRPNAAAWAASAVAGSFARLSNWEQSPHNINKDAGSTGAFADQVFVRAEPMVDVAATLPTYLEGFRWGARPQHHLREDGSIFADPGLRLWGGQPHVASGSITLGKSSMSIPWRGEGGWTGSDLEHWTINGLAAAVRYTGSPALQRLLEHEANVYLHQRLVGPGAGANGAIFSARDLLWEPILVVHLWRELRDRVLAETVKARYLARWATIIQPYLAVRGDVWDIRTVTSASVPIAPGYLPWQQGPAAWAMDYAGRVFGIPGVREIAMRGALRVLADVWHYEGGRWVEYERVAMNGQHSRSGDFQVRWFAPVIALIRRYEPGNTKAAAIWQQMAEGGEDFAVWAPPEVQP